MSPLRRIAIQFLALLFSVTFLQAQCSVDRVLIRGRVEHPTPKSRVRALLLYPNDQPGESAETNLTTESFRIPIEFLTQNKKPLLANLHAKCDRKPKAVVVTLREGDKELDQVTLDLAKDFDNFDPTAYTLRSEIVLKKPNE